MPGPFLRRTGPSTRCSLYPRLLLLTLAVALLVPSSSCSADNLEEPPRVITPHGTYIGRHVSSTRQERPVFAFTGIPYASPPLHHLRFAVSQLQKFAIVYAKLGQTHHPLSTDDSIRVSCPIIYFGDWRM